VLDKYKNNVFVSILTLDKTKKFIDAND